MDALTATARNLKGRECLPQYFLDEDALENALAAQVHVRLRRRVGGDALRTLEIVIVVAAAAAERERDLHATLAPAARPTRC